MIVRNMRTNNSPRLPALPAAALFGKSMQAILAQLFGRTEESFYLRELARAAGSPASSLQRDLAALTRAGIITRTARGHQIHYQANRASPVFEELRGLVVKTFGVADVLSESLLPLSQRIDVAFIYGSVAMGEERAESDIDVMVIGKAGFGDVVEALVPARQRLAREINPSVYSGAEFTAKVRAGNAFLKNVVAEPKLFLIGGDHELGGLARKGRASDAQAVRKRIAGSARPRRVRPHR